MDYIVDITVNQRRNDLYRTDVAIIPLNARGKRSKIHSCIDKSFYYMGSQHEAVAQAEEYAERTITLHAGEEAKIQNIVTIL